MEFFERCTIDSDHEHILAGANPDDNFKDHLHGTFTQKPEIAESVSAVCGLPAERIQQLTREISGTQPVALIAGCTAARIHNRGGWVYAHSLSLDS